MFTKTASQRAQHSDGYIVEVGSRFSLRYLDRGTVAEIEIDVGPVTGIYTDTLVLKDPFGKVVALDPKRHQLILERIVGGMECLGVKFELCRKSTS